MLIPWPNRIEDGSYEFDGRSHQLALDDPAEQDAIHGLVRWVAWNVAERDSNRVVMEHLLRPQPGYPFLLEVRIEYMLSDEGLRVRTTATNVGPDRCPYGAGAHPYPDPRHARGRLAGPGPVPGRTVLESDERGIPVRAGPVEGTEFDFVEPRPVGPTRLDHRFTDLYSGDDGRARVELRDPGSDTGLALWVDETYRYLMIFTGDPVPDVSRRSLAVEPMTCPPNAFRSGEGLVTLEPGRPSPAPGASAARQPEWAARDRR